MTFKINRYLFLFFFLLTIVNISNGQVAKFTEIFDEANGATTGTSAEGIPWNSTYTPCNFPTTGVQPSVNAGRFRDNNSDGTTRWTTGNINVSQCKEIKFTVDYWTPNQWIGAGGNNLEACDESGTCPCNVFNGCVGGCNTQWDFIYVELKLDGNIVYTETVGITVATSPTTYTFTYNSPCLNKGQYNNAVVTIMTQTWASDEYIYFDNVSLSCFEFPAFSLTDPSPICEASSDIQLNVSPPGGTYSGGPYVSPSGVFSPTTAGPGLHNVQYSVTPGMCTSDTIIQIQVTPAVTPTFNAIPPQCAGGSNPLTNTSNEGITGSWTPAFNPNATTTYTFTPNPGQCANTTTLTVTITPLTTPTFNAIPPQCTGGSNPLTNTSNEGITGSWSPAFNPNATTTYTFTPNPGQCANTTTLTVTISPITTPTFNAIPPLCAGGSNPLTNTSNEGITGSWSPAFNPNATTTYTFTPNPGQCANTTTLTVTINNLPAITINPIPDICPSDPPYTLSGTPPGGTWAGAGVTGNTIDPSSLPFGQHSVTYTYTDGNGCTNSTSATFNVIPCGCTNPPNVNAGADNAICANQTFTTAGILTNTVLCTWTTSGDGVFANPGNPVTTYTPGTNDIAAGTVTLTITTPDPDGAGPCTGDSDAMILTINATPVLNFPGGINICQNTCQSIVLSVTGGSGNYNADLVITSPITFTIPTIAINGSVTFTICYQGNVPAYNAATNTLTIPPILVPSGTNVTFALNNLVDNNTGCQGVLSGSSITSITVLANPTVTADPAGPLCTDDAPITLTGSPVGGTWSGQGVTNGVFDPATAGQGTHTLTYTYTDGSGCMGSTTINVVVNNCSCPLNTMVEAGANVTTCDINAISLSGSVVNGTGYYWTTSGNGAFGDPSDLNTTYTPSTDDYNAGTVTISLIVPDPDGIGPCTELTDQFTITFNQSPDFSISGNLPICSESCNTLIIDFTSGPGPYSGSISVSIGADNYTYSVGNYSDIANLQICYRNGPASYDAATNTIYVPLHPGQVQMTVTFSNFINTTNTCPAAPDQQVIIPVSDPANLQLQPIGSVCVIFPPITLQATPAGGDWSGPGVANGIFNPVIAGVGQHVLTYSFTDGNGCTTTDTIHVQVEPCGCDNPPIVDAGPNFIICPGDFANLLGSANGPTVWFTAGTGTFDDINDPTTIYTPSPADIASGSIILSLTVADPDGAGPCTAVTDKLTLTFHTPNVTMTPNPDVCINGSILTLTGSPAGGTFLGNGVSGNQFNPTVAGPGDHIITYNATDNSCPGKATDTIHVFGKPTITLSFPDSVCLNDGLITLAANPSTGTFSGTGVSNNQFDPAIAGPGIWTITYTYNDGTCTWTENKDIKVKDCNCATPAIANAGPDQVICSNVQILLNGSVTTTAVWTTSGSGTFVNPNSAITNYTPSPADIAAGTVTLTLTSGDPDGNGPCLSASNAMIVTFNIINIQLDSLQDVCISSQPIVLTAQPSGGTWSGIGVTGNTFNPTSAGIGNFNLRYTYQSGNCNAIANVSIQVFDLPTVTLAPFDTLCIKDPTITLSGGSPSGGKYYLNGDLNTPITTFDPSIPGTYTITYIAGTKDCEGTASQNILVKDCDCITAVTVFTGNDTTICKPTTIQLNGKLTGVSTGTWTSSGTGTFNNATLLTPIYSPSTADLTKGFVILTFTSEDPDGNGPCLASFDDIRINFEKEPEVLLLVTQPTCIIPTGSVLINVLTGQNLQYSIDNGLTFSTNINFNNLLPNTYKLIVKSINSSCQTDLDFTIDPFTEPVGQWKPNPAICSDADYNSISLLSTEHLTLPIQATVNGNIYPIINSLPYDFKGLPNGVYSIVLTDKDNCVLTKTFTFDSSSSISVDINPVYIIDEGDQVTLNPEINGDFDFIQWNPSTYLSCNDCLNPISKPLSDISYTVIVTDKNGCQDQASLQIKIRKKLNVFIPNIISPNHDGINDEFTVYTDDDVVLVKSMKIFHRWGGQVFARTDFEPNDPKLGWNGIYNGQQENPAVFVYLIELQLKNGDVKIFSGDVTLMR